MNERELCRLGNDALTKGLFEEGVAWFTKAINLAPYNKSCWSNRGYSYYRMVEHDKALNDLHVALAIKPDNVSSICCIGHIYAEKHQHERALKYYTKAIKQNPNDGLTLSFRASIYFKTHQVDKAIIDCKESLRLDPNLDTVHYKLGVIFLSKNLSEQALKHFQDGVKICSTIPYRVAFNTKIALCYADMKNYKKAFEFCEVARKFSCKETSAHVESALSSIYYKQKNFKKALEFCEKSCKLDANSINAPHYLYKKAKCLTKLEKFDEAIELCITSWKINNQETNAINLLGYIFYLLGKYEKSLNFCNESIEMNPFQSKFLRIRSYVLRDTGKLKLAKQDMDKSIELNDRSGKSFKERSIITEKMLKIIENEEGKEEEREKLRKMIIDDLTSATKCNSKYQEKLDEKSVNFL